MIDWSTCSAVQSHPQIVGGAWVFHGTRIPITALFENLEDGADIGHFLNWFPGVKQEQVKRVLDHAADSARASA